MKYCQCRGYRLRDGARPEAPHSAIGAKPSAMPLRIATGRSAAYAVLENTLWRIARGPKRDHTNAPTAVKTTQPWTNDARYSAERPERWESLYLRRCPRQASLGLIPQTPNIITTQTSIKSKLNLKLQRGKVRERGNPPLPSVSPLQYPNI